MSTTTKMKHFLVATDFSETAQNAVKYAVELAKLTKATITLVHVYNVPVMISDAPVMPVIAFEDLQNENLELLKRIELEISHSAPEVKIKCIAEAGFANNEIIELGKPGNYDLIIMGIKGHNLVSAFLGSTATAVALDARVPVLIVPAEACFENLASLAFAFDFKEINETANLDLLRDLAGISDAKIHVLYVAGDTREIPVEQTLVTEQMDDILEGLSHDLSFPSKDEPVKGIEDYLKLHKSDMLVMIRRKHGFFDRMFNGSYTKEMAFHTYIPLLVLHD